MILVQILDPEEETVHSANWEAIVVTISNFYFIWGHGHIYFYAWMFRQIETWLAVVKRLQNF